MSGVQALVRLPMLQRTRDALRRAEHRRLHQRLPRLAARRLRPGAVGGQEAPGRSTTSSSSPASTRSSAPPRCGARSSSTCTREKKKYDGVFGIWYGKGPGVDRCIDVFKHANMAGTAQARRRDRDRRRRPRRQEQHRARTRATTSSRPAACRCSSRRSVQDILDMGLHAFAMSRFSGVWTRHEDDPGGRRVVGVGRRSTPTA